MTLWDQILLNAPVLLSSLPLMNRALEIAIKAKIAVYHGHYVALAEPEGCDMVTTDDRLIKILQSDFPFIVSPSSI